MNRVLFYCNCEERLHFWAKQSKNKKKLFIIVFLIIIIRVIANTIIKKTLFKLNQLQIKQAKQSLSNPDEEQQIFVANTWQGKELIEFDSIYFFRSDQKYLTVVHANGEALSDQTLKDLEQSYPDQLIRVHRNTLINKAHINSLLKKNDGHYEIQIKNSSHCISVSRRHVSDIKSYLASLL